MPSIKVYGNPLINLGLKLNKFYWILLRNNLINFLNAMIIIFQYANLNWWNNVAEIAIYRLWFMNSYLRDTNAFWKFGKIMANSFTYKLLWDQLTFAKLAFKPDVICRLHFYL